MIVLKDIYKEIRQYWINKSDIIVESDSNIMINNELIFKGQSFYPTLLSSPENNNILIYDHPNIYNSKIERIIQLKEGFGFELLLENNYYLCTRRNPDNFEERSFSLFRGDKKVNESKFFSFKAITIQSKTIFFCLGQKENLMFAYSVFDSKILWDQNINLFFNTKGVKTYANRLQIIDNKLFFFAHDSNWENYGTFCLDANTGEVLKRIEMAGFIYKHNDYIYVTNGKFITQINPDTFEIERIDLSGELKELDLIIDGERSFFFKDKLYFAAKPGDNTTRSVLGVLDLNSYKLLETYELLRDPSQPSCNENRYQIQNIKANDYQVAVNTAGDTLHVFEIKD